MVWSTRQQTLPGRGGALGGRRPLPALSWDPVAQTRHDGAAPRPLEIRAAVTGGEGIEPVIRLRDQNPACCHYTTPQRSASRIGAPTTIEGSGPPALPSSRDGRRPADRAHHGRGAWHSHAVVAAQ